MTDPRAKQLCDAIGHRLREAMDSQKCSVRALAHDANVSQRTITRILAGENTSVATLYRIAAELELDLTDLVRDPAA